VLSDNGNEFRGGLNERSINSAPAIPASAQVDPKPTATSNASTAPSSKNAGDPHSHATSNPATAASKLELDAYVSTTSTAPTPAASPKATHPAQLVYGARKMEPR
jgi:hypothetical protein